MTILNAEALAPIMIGATHVVDMGGVEAHIYYEADSKAHIQLPGGKRMHGRWELMADGYRVEWSEGPTAVWKLDHESAGINYVDTGGLVRGRLARIVFGDSAGIAS